MQTEWIKPTSVPNQVILCTHIDEMLSRIPVTVGFFYDYQLDLAILKEGFQRALSEFPLFSGCLLTNAEGCLIQLDDRGIRFTATWYASEILEAMVQIPEDAPEIDLFDILNLHAYDATTSPLCTVKVSYFANNRMCIGVCWHHAVGDMQSFMHFMRAVSDAIAGRVMKKPMIVSNRDQLLQETLPQNMDAQPGIRYLDDLQKQEFSDFLANTAKNKRRIQIYFTEEELLCLKKDFLSKGKVPLSTNDVLCAHMFGCIAEADPQKRDRYLSITVNYRPRFNLPENLLGNIITSINIMVEKECQSRPVVIAQRLREAILEFADRHLDYFANIALINQYGGSVATRNFIPKGLDPINGTILVTNWSKFGVYSIDFGKRAPFYFTQKSSQPFPWVSGVVDGFDNKGLIFTTNLPTEVVEGLISSDMLATIHRYRSNQEVLPTLANALPWVK